MWSFAGSRLQVEASREGRLSRSKHGSGLSVSSGCRRARSTRWILRRAYVDAEASADGAGSAFGAGRSGGAVLA